MIFFDRKPVKGWTEITLRDRDGFSKPLFQCNWLWIALNKAFGIDIRIPFLTGFWTYHALKMNTITTRGKRKIAELLGGTDVTPVEYIGIGTGTPGSTALGAEITNGGGARASANVSNVTTSTTGDTEQFQVTFSFSLAKAVTEEGLFDNPSAGNMLASQSFPVINVQPNDLLTITHKIQITT